MSASTNQHDHPGPPAPRNCSSAHSSDDEQILVERRDVVSEQALQIGPLVHAQGGECSPQPPLEELACPGLPWFPGSTPARESSEGRLVMVRDVGIGYANLRPIERATRFTGDALVLSAALLRRFWAAAPEWRTTAVQIRAPEDLAHKRVSDGVSCDLLQDTSILRTFWEPEIE